MIILVDVDGVCADLCTAWLTKYNKDYGDVLTVGDITAWEMTQFVKPECGKKIYDYLHHPDLYDEVLPVVGASWGVDELRCAGHEIIYLSSSPGGEMMRAKMDWLKKWGFLEYGDVIQVSAHHLKQHVYADLMIDDYEENLKIANTAQILLFDQHHNQHADAGIPRAYGWMGVVRHVHRKVA